MLVKDLLVDRILTLQEKTNFPGWRWNKKLARYQDRVTGRIVSQKSLTNLGEKFIADVTVENINTMTAKMLDGSWTLDQWQVNVAHELKDAYTVETMLGKGGRQAMTYSDWGRMGSRLKYQYARLENFAFEIKSGKLTEGQIEMRARMYGNSARQAFFDGATHGHMEAGFTHEQRLLAPVENCEDCDGYARRGIVPIGTLPEPGQESVCRTNCYCVKIYFRQDENGIMVGGL